MRHPARESTTIRFASDGAACAHPRSRAAVSGLFGCEASTIYPLTGTDPSQGRLASVWLELRRRSKALRIRLACIYFGHEKWTAQTNDWACMRCGRVEMAEVLPSPYIVRSELTELPDFLRRRTP